MKVLITGASEGIGLEISKLMARQGNQLMLVARNEEKLEKAIQNLPGTGHGFMVADLSTKEGSKAVEEHLAQNHYDVLINNAGVAMYGRFEEMPLEKQLSMIDLNVYNLTILAYSFLKHAKKGDALVNLASTLGTTSFPGLAAYSATKAYVMNFSESLWWENKKRGIYVLGFCPGVTSTTFHDTGGSSLDVYPHFIKQTPQAVARELIVALQSRSNPNVVSGWANRSMLAFHRLLGRKAVVNMMGGFSPVK